jgi:cobalt/nickel transport system permease protein
LHSHGAGHHIEHWSRGLSPIHKLHAVTKIVAALTLLVCIATLTERTPSACVAYLLFLGEIVIVSKLPLGHVLMSAAAVLPFAVSFAIVSALSGQPERAVMLVVRGYLSALTALILISTTPAPALFEGLETLRAPRFLIQVMQFLHRYLVVLTEESRTMRDAAASRAGSIHTGGGRTLELRKAAGALSVLFSRSYNRAEHIHQAMMARGFEGHIPRFQKSRLRPADAFLGVLAAATFVFVRIVIE